MIQSVRDVPTYRYRPQILEQLACHGLRPRPETAPARLKEQVNDLYRYELRQLRERLLRREIPRPEYAAHVVALRKKYLLLSVPLGRWTAG